MAQSGLNALLRCEVHRLERATYIDCLHRLSDAFPLK